MRRLLLDTHVLLWWLADDARLGKGARASIREPRNEIHVSAASGWEISIKRAPGKLEAPDDLDSILAEEGFEELPISFFHAERAGALPPLHRDPLARMLIAQAQAKGLDILTCGRQFNAYGVRFIDAAR